MGIEIFIIFLSARKKKKDNALIFFCWELERSYVCGDGAAGGCRQSGAGTEPGIIDSSSFGSARNAGRQNRADDGDRSSCSLSQISGNLHDAADPSGTGSATEDLWG